MAKRACNMGVYDQSFPLSTWLCLDLYLFHVKYQGERYEKLQQGNLLIWADVCSCPWHSTWMMWFRNLSDCYSACELLLTFQTEHSIQHYSACAIVHILKNFQTSNMACVQSERCFWFTIDEKQRLQTNLCSKIFSFSILERKPRHVCKTEGSQGHAWRPWQ